MDALFWPFVGLFVLGIVIILVATFKGTVDTKEDEAL